ncbi:sulfatase [Candidatus Woesearchaeota archaeon]|nr:sulfatase [Candidatus Woesearchaeota archaeon]
MAGMGDNAKAEKAKAANKHARPNIIIFIIDALRADHLSCYGYGLKTSPHIDELAKKGIIFENAFSCMNATEPSVTTILSGKHPRTHGILHHGNQVTEEEIEGFTKTGTKLLQEILKENSYMTFGMDWLSRWHKRGFDYYHGITTSDLEVKRSIVGIIKGIPLLGQIATFAFRHMLPKRLTDKVRVSLDGKQITRKAIELIEQNKGAPFFMLLHYWDTHVSFNAPNGIYKKFLKDEHNGKKYGDFLKNVNRETVKEFYEGILDQREDMATVIAKYDGAINYVDRIIRQITSKLEAEGISDNTIIVITADHGESLVEHEILFDDHALYEPSIHVPLIIYYPKAVRQGRFSQLVQHTDLMPTLLELAGLSACAPKDMDGKSLIQITNGNTEKLRDYIYAEETYNEEKATLRGERYKIIKSVSGKGTCRRCRIIHGADKELYDLETDPKELNNIAETEKKALQEMEERLETLKSHFNTKREKSRIANAISGIKA